jgi:nucleoid-associated protein YgaU
VKKKENMKIRHLLFSTIILAITATSCGDKKPKEVKVESPKQEVVKPDTVIAEPEPVIEEVIEEVPTEHIITVKKGEWLYDIARAEYGSMHEWRKIYEANKDKIDNPDMIYPNQELIIPE